MEGGLLAYAAALRDASEGVAKDLVGDGEQLDGAEVLGK